MAIQNRTVTIKGIFAEEATTTIPQTPVSEISYRDTGLSVAEVKAGWPFKVVVDSSKFNEYLYELSTISRQFEIYGFLPWSASTNYETGSCCLGTDGKIYQAKRNTGPSSTAKDPVTDSSHTYWQPGFARLPDNNTWTGTNAFGTITVPNRSSGDSTTNAANTAFVTTAVNSVNNNALHKTGNETAAGTKTFSSSPIIPTPSTSDNSTKSATTAFVYNKILSVLSSIYPVGSLYIGTQTTCPMASLISGSTWTLVSSGKALWTGTGSNANTTIGAGLPNITGTFGAADGLSSTVREVNFNTASGAFSLNKSTNNFGTWDSSRSVNGGKTVSLDASKSSSIYGNSSTVQPPAYIVNVWRRTA